MLSELFRTAFAWIVILPAAFLTGTFYERLVLQRDTLLRGILYYALGLATLSYGVVFLSALHLLNVQCVWGMLLLPIILRLNKLRGWLQWLKDLGSDLWPRSVPSSKLLFLLFITSFVCLLMGTLTPEIGGDALCYQLNMPKVFLRHGSLMPDPLDYNTYFPLLMNNLYLIGLAMGGVLSAKLFHFLCGFLLFLVIRRVVQNETGNRLLSFFIALVVFTTPAIYNLISTTYIDVALAFYTFLAVITFMDALNSGSNKNFLLSGLFAGCAVSMKYLALISVVGLFVVWLLGLVTRRQSKLYLNGGGFFVLGILVASGYWFARNWGATGNPFFPYFGSLFGEANRTPTDFYLFGFGWSWFHYLSLFFNMFLSPNNFGAFTTRIGVFYFLLTPFIFLAMIFVPRARGYGIFWLVFTAVIFFIAQADRWIIPVLPVMAACAGMGIHWFYSTGSEMLKKVIKIVGGGVAIFILFVYVLAGAYHYRYAYLLFTGQWSPEKYRTSLERTTTIAEWINKNLPRDVKILVESETRVFYMDRPLVKRVFLEWHLKDPKIFKNPKASLALLRSNGFTHVLSTDLIRGGKVISESRSLGESLVSLSGAKEIFSVASDNVREDRYYYRLFEIKGMK
ncbi:MAG: glycosyltransferase family 39 protein [Candidatus Omnitrophota bacterium]|jgi:hypothetical protein